MSNLYKEYVENGREKEYLRILNRIEDLRKEFRYTKSPLKTNYTIEFKETDSNYGFFQVEDYEERLKRKNGFIGLFEGKYNFYTPHSLLSTCPISPKKISKKIKINTEACPCIVNNDLYTHNNKTLLNNQQQPFFIDRNIKNKIISKLAYKISDFDFKKNQNKQVFNSHLKTNDEFHMNNFQSKVGTNINSINQRNDRDEIKYNQEENIKNNNIIEDDPLDYNTSKNKILKIKFDRLNNIKSELKNRLMFIENLDSNSNACKSQISNENNLSTDYISKYNNNDTIKLKILNKDEYDMDEVRIYLTNQRRYHLKEILPKVVERSSYLFDNISKNSHCITCANLLSKYRTTNFCPKCHY